MNSIGRSMLAWAVVLAVCFVSPSIARAGGGPEGVAVVVNAQSWASMAVANEYIHLRKIPPANVVYLNDVTTFETIGIEEFRQKILKPVMAALTERGVYGHIDCIAYSSDLPYSIFPQADATKEQLEKVFPAQIIRILTLEASINSMTYLYDLVLAKDIRYLDLAINGYCPQQASRVKEGARWVFADAKSMQAAEEALVDKKYDKAEPLLQALLKDHGDSAEVTSRLAVCQVHLGKLDEAMASLQAAAKAGWQYWWRLQGSDEFKALRAREGFAALIETMKTATPSVQCPDAVAFDANTVYRSPRDGASGGRKYMLSTMLAVTSGRGNSVSEALAQLRRSAASDGQRPQGAVYFMANGDVRSTAREWAFASAAAKLNAMDVPAEILWGVLPQKKTVAGLVVGAAGFNWATCGSTIDAGAICEHLTSYGGIMRESRDQTPLSEFLRFGAAGASGSVMEPFAIQAKFPSPFIQAYYAQGASLAEAFYMSVSGPYQLLIVGDPLCQPWATIPEVDVATPASPVKGKLTLTPAVKQHNLPILRYELYVDGRLTASSAKASLDLDTEKIADGYHELRVVAVAENAVRTRGREVLPITVANQGLALTVTGPATKEVAWGSDEKIVLTARMAGAKKIVFTCNGRVVREIPADEGEVQIDPRQLGQGPVEIHAVATVDAEGGEMAVAAEPVAVTITPPPPLDAMTLPEADKLAKGVQITLENGSRCVVEQAMQNWLTAAGVKAKEAFTIEGWLEAPCDDVYQFQVHSAAPLVLEVDGKPLAASGQGWQFAPVTLARGLHKFVARGRADEKGDLDIRFGGSGAQNILGRFQHVAIEGERIILPPPPKSQPATSTRPASAPATKSATAATSNPTTTTH